MNSALDLALSRAIYGLRAMERALHDRGPWHMEYAGERVPANRFVLDDSVQFCGRFPGRSGDGDAAVSLFCAGDYIGTLHVETPTEGSFIVDWTFHLPVSVGV